MLNLTMSSGRRKCRYVERSAKQTPPPWQSQSSTRAGRFGDIGQTRPQRPDVARVRRTCGRQPRCTGAPFLRACRPAWRDCKGRLPDIYHLNGGGARKSKARPTRAIGCDLRWLSGVFTRPPGPFSTDVSHGSHLPLVHGTSCSAITYLWVCGCMIGCCITSQQI